MIFIAIGLASCILLAGSFFFGRDLSHDIRPTISFVSIKVIAALTAGFGVAGAIARVYGAEYLVASFVGFACGIALSLLMYFIQGLIYRRQASSIVSPSSALGHTGIVQTGIGPGVPGEVSLNLGGQHMTYLAKSNATKEIPKGRPVKVVGLVGSQLVVEEM